ncbi:MAG: hypothetical protein Ct9H300mP25_09220 [Acidobacteriota bacterium]|nr:MAG: hypothetical protein Ct9H300mP25_09220 [Acidobacteriota bacterium]
MRVMLRGVLLALKTYAFKNSPTERPFQAHRKSGPASAGLFRPLSQFRSVAFSAGVSYSPAPVGPDPRVDGIPLDVVLSGDWWTSRSTGRAGYRWVVFQQSFLIVLN